MSDEADVIATRVLDLFAKAPQAARLRFLRDLMASTGRAVPDALPAAPTPVLHALEASRRLGCSRSKVYALFKAGELRGHTVGGRVVIRLDSIEAYLTGRQNEKPPADPQPDQPAASSDPEPARRPRKPARRAAQPMPGGYRFFPPGP